MPTTTAADAPVATRLTPELDGAVSVPASLERIGTLDVLRGIALLGMFLVHFHDFTLEGEATGLAAIYRQIVTLFFEERFWAMFAILFGVGFAVQLQRAEARGRSFVPLYLRRLLALAGFGIIAHAVFGFNVLLGYAAWGFPLLFMRRWSVKTLVVALALSAASASLFYIARASYGASRIGTSAYAAERDSTRAANRAFNQANRAAQESPSYPAVFRARLAHMKWFYAQPFSFLPVNTLTLFLIGVIGFRLRLYDRPAEHRRLIAGLMIFGIAAWAADLWLLPAGPWPFDKPPIGPMVLGHLEHGFGFIRTMWLTFAYIGAILLLVAHNPAWLRRLGAFGWTGRMALTIYMIQIAILDLMFSNYALHVTLTPLQGLVAGLMLFGLNAVFSRWWLARYRFGPLEWVWRSITYGARQPWRVA